MGTSEKTDFALCTYIDWGKRDVVLWASDWLHICAGHSKAAQNGLYNAVEDTINDPDSVYRSKSHPNTREVYFKRGAANYGPNTVTKIICAYGEDDIKGNHVVTAFVKDKEGGNISDCLYKRK